MSVGWNDASTIEEIFLTTIVRFIAVWGLQVHIASLYDEWFSTSDLAQFNHRLFYDFNTERRLRGSLDVLPGPCNWSGDASYNGCRPLQKNTSWFLPGARIGNRLSRHVASPLKCPHRDWLQILKWSIHENEDFRFNFNLILSINRKSPSGFRPLRLIVHCVHCVHWWLP